MVEPPAVALVELTSGLTAPVSIAAAPDGSGRLFVVDQVGTIWIITPAGERLEQPFLDIRSRVVELEDSYDERGLLGDVFDATAVIAPPERLAGDVGGNFVMVGTDAVDATAIQRQLDARGEGEQVITGASLDAFIRDAPVLTDAYAPVDQMLEPQPAAG